MEEDKGSATAHTSPLQDGGPCASLPQFTDRFNQTFYFGDAGDYRHPPFPVGPEKDYTAHARKIEELEVRADDILLYSFPKTGAHWHFEIIKMLVKKKAEYTQNHELEESFLDMMGIDRIHELPSPRILVTHVPAKHLPKQVFEKQVKVVYVERNPKDTLVSYYSLINKHEQAVHYPGTFEQFVSLNLETGLYYRPLFDFSLEWQSCKDAHPDLLVHTSAFEDMKADSVAGVKQLNDFLGTDCSPELCEDIVTACSFQKLKKNKDDQSLQNRQAQGQSPYRKGEVGDWKNWFTVALNETFDRAYAEVMADYRFHYKYTL